MSRFGKKSEIDEAISFLDEIEAENKQVHGQSPILEFIKRKTKKPKMTKRALVIAAYERQKMYR